MKHGIQTVRKPTDPNSLYMRNLYHEYFWGPFSSEEELTRAVIALDKIDPYWDYEPFCIIYGADPLPCDFVNGFPFAGKDLRDRIERARESARS